MSSRVLSVVGLVICLLSVAALPVEAEEPVPRILIIGDSWAASIATTHHDPIPPGFGSFDAVLKECGLGGYATYGGPTAWGGRKASDWVKPQNAALIDAALAEHPTIDIVHLIIGGNDFLVKVAKGKSVTSYTKEEREALWNAIQADIKKIVDHVLSIRPDIRVVISDYDYLNAAQAEAVLPDFDFGGATPEELNRAFMELGKKKREIAETTDRCYYVSHWGRLQHHYADPREGLPLPGNPPDYTPYAGGDPKAPMPVKVNVGDGVHPTDEAHRHMLRVCVELYYREWLTTTGAQPAAETGVHASPGSGN